MSYVNQTLYATLTWSAPGGDFDHGKAAGYEIRCYTNQIILADDSFISSGIPVHESLLPKPLEYGSEQTVTVGLPWANEIFYYGLVAIDSAGNRSPVSNLVPVFVAEVITAPSDLQNDIDAADSSATLDDPMAVLGKFGNNLYLIIAAGVASLFIIIIIFALVKFCRKRKQTHLKAQNNARTQDFVNDLDTQIHSNVDHAHISGFPSLGQEEKSQFSYGGVWSSNGNHSPSSDLSNELNMMYNNNKTNSSMSDQASWAYLSGNLAGRSTVPVHEFRSTLSSTEEEGGIHQQQVTPTYQNWQKPPSDNGTTATSSTECSTTYDESEHPDKMHATVVVSGIHGNHQYLNGLNVGQHDTYTACDPTTMSLTPSFLSERRRRQESLV
jgi:hypothetical protein